MFFHHESLNTNQECNRDVGIEISRHEAAVRASSDLPTVVKACDSQRQTGLRINSVPPCGLPVRVQAPITGNARALVRSFKTGLARHAHCFSLGNLRRGSHQN